MTMFSVYKNSIINYLESRYKFSKPIVKLFGIFGIINYPVFYIFWQYITHSAYDDLIYRLIAAILCFGLIFIDSVPLKIKKYIPIYWFITVLYCIPFFGTLMFLKNHASDAWVLNSILGLFWLILILDVKSFMLILPVGIILAIIFFIAQGNKIILNYEGLSLTLINVIWVIITTLVFSSRREHSYAEKIKGMKTIAGAIAHEMRTPLNTITNMVNNLENYIPSIIEQYKNSSSISLTPIKKVKSKKEKEQVIKFLQSFTYLLEKVTRNAFTFIDMLLIRLKSDIHNTKHEIISAKYITHQALELYPLTEDESELIMLELKEDFKFKGNKLLFTHVIFNLLKNALYFVKAKPNKGKIIITTNIGTDESNIISFRDTGVGINQKTLPHIFDEFYTSTEHGTGIGLAFCRQVIQNFGGTIFCDSIEGEYTMFIIKFPKIPN